MPDTDGVSATTILGAPLCEPPLMDREALVRRGLWLNYFGIGYNVLESLAALLAGLLAGSVALVGFGIDSVIEVCSSAAAQWRLRSDLEAAHREHAERVTVRMIGWCFLALATYVLVDGARALWFHERSTRSVLGIVVLVLSVVVMPLLARAKRTIARALGSAALNADATQTSLCAYLSLIALAGVALNGVIGWWWADPVAAIAMVPIIAREGIEGVRGKACCSECLAD